MGNEVLVGGRFRIDRRVGAGGMGEVFRARDLDADRWVAVKLFAWRSASEVERAHREVQVLAQLRHPAIVGHVADGVTDDGQLFLAMEWVDGTTVADRLDGDGLSVRESIAMIRPIASALAHAHQVGFLHRDIKPSNVVLVHGDPTNAMLIDFGVARVLDAVRALTRTGTAIGTPGYMSPEQARGERELTPAIDVFGLGCLLYECLTGRPAFSGTVAAAVMAKILFAEPTPIGEQCGEAPSDLIALVERMLTKQLVHRIPDCESVLAAIDALGPLPAGPRRNARSLSSVTVVPPATSADVHCMVGASRGALDDMLDPPSAESCAKLVTAADDHGASLELFASGAVIAHLMGEPRAISQRAASLALAMRGILPKWAIVISSTSAGIGPALETGTQLLNATAMAAIFNRSPDALQIGLDAATASLLSDGFEVTGGKAPRLVGRKQP